MLGSFFFSFILVEMTATRSIVADLTKETN